MNAEKCEDAINPEFDTNNGVNCEVQGGRCLKLITAGCTAETKNSRTHFTVPDCNKSSADARYASDWHAKQEAYLDRYSASRGKSGRGAYGESVAGGIRRYDDYDRSSRYRPSRYNDYYRGGNSETAPETVPTSVDTQKGGKKSKKSKKSKSRRLDYGSMMLYGGNKK